MRRVEHTLFVFIRKIYTLYNEETQKYLGGIYYVK